MCKLCVFAGTSEGRRLVELLAGRGAEITACVATEYGEALMDARPGLRIRAGRMDQNEMADFLAREGFELVVDATHPYADQATENIHAACARAGVEYLRLLRESTADGSDGVRVPDAAHCAEYLKTVEGNVLLTTGSKDLPAFCADEALRGRLYARVLPMAASLEICAQCGIQPDHILAMQGPFDEEMNLSMIRATRARWLVTKDTGGAGGYGEKIRAAERAGVGVVVIGRPRQRAGNTLEEIMRLLEARLPLTSALKRVTLVGIGPGNADCQTLGLQRAVEEADCLIGARRMLDAVDAREKPRLEEISPAKIAGFIRASVCARRFAVLLSGDSGFYSGARRLIEELRDVELEVLPGIGSLSYLCAKLRRSWEDVRAVSLHGRNYDLVREVLENPAVFALVGGRDGAKNALLRLCEAGLGGLKACVGERLGYPDERISQGSVDQLSEGGYDDLSVVLVENDAWSAQTLRMGLPDEAFARDEVPMTKSEVRCVSLSKLELSRNAVVYDVGAGSGSVTVEAALIARGGRVYAIERKARALELTRQNVRKFHLENVEMIEGCAPEALDALPAPTHAFIGGSSGNLRGIVDCLLKKNPGVRIVANAVTLETLSELTEIGRAFDFCDVVQMSVSKPRKVGGYQLMTAQNPVYIFTLQNQR